MKVLSPSTKYYIEADIWDSKGLFIHRTNRCCVPTAMPSIDPWNEELLPKQFSMEQSTLTVTRSSFQHAFGSEWCSIDIHEWEFEVKRISGEFAIGVDHHEYQNRVHVYEFNLNGGHFNKLENGSRDYTRYGKICSAGDTVMMILNLKRNTLSYGINGIIFGDAFQIPENKYTGTYPRKPIYRYRMTVSMTNTGDSIELKSYRKFER